MSDDHVKELINRLQSPLSDVSELLPILAGPLDCLNLLPPKFRRFNVDPLPQGALVPHRHIPSLQCVLLEHVAETWRDALAGEGATVLLEQYFCPDTFLFASRAAGEVTLLAYSSILALPLTDFSIHLLVRLTKEYPIDRLHSVVDSDGASHAGAKRCFSWEDGVRNVVAVPAKVANSLGVKGEKIPSVLEHAVYFNNLSSRCELLISSLSRNGSKDHLASVTYLLTKLVNLGVFPPSPPTARSQPSFFQTTLPTIRSRFHADDHREYSSFWSNILLSLPSSLTLQAILTSLFSSLAQLPRALDPSPRQRALVKREAVFLGSFIGKLKVDNEELWECISAVILSREWNEGQARIFACWVAGGDGDYIDTEALGVLLEKVVDMWSSPEQVRHSVPAKHRYLTALLLLTASQFPLPSDHLNALAFSPSFISGIGKYIGHLDHSIRRCGMLVAEVMATYAGKKLDFGDWEGDDAGRTWAGELRELIGARDVDAQAEGDDVTEGDEAGQKQPESSAVGTETEETHEPKPTDPFASRATSGYDSDDSLTGYASPALSRSPSPTRSELEEIEKDPTLHVGIKKVPRPVYLAQLGEMVRSTSGLQVDAHEQALKVEMALDCAQVLIRRKRDYGTELEENVVNLIYGFVGLQDNYDTDGFETKRQSAVHALVACCPRKAAPTIIQEFFKNQYSIDQRFAMLNALALGARELASLPLPPQAVQPVSSARTAFPSRMLPEGLHQRYITGNDPRSEQVRHLLTGITREAIERGKEASADKIPELVRERRLRIRQPAKVTEVTHSQALNALPLKHKTTFTEVATEFFLARFINHFWVFLRDEQTREERTAQLDRLHRYRGAGTALILNPMVLAQFLTTLAVLVHAARNAPEWLAVVAPDALELAVTLGTRPVSLSEGGDDDDEDDDGTETGNRSAERHKEKEGKEAAVLSTALEVALIVLDGCLEVDGGRSIGLEHTALVLATGEWADTVLTRMEKGVRVAGGGGAQEVRLRRAAGGVLIKVDELSSRWKRSMIDVR